MGYGSGLDGEVRVHLGVLERGEKERFSEHGAVHAGLVSLCYYTELPWTSLSSCLPCVFFFLDKLFLLLAGGNIAEGVSTLTEQADASGFPRTLAEE